MAQWDSGGCKFTPTIFDMHVRREASLLASERIEYGLGYAAKLMDFDYFYFHRLVRSHSVSQDSDVTNVNTRRTREFFPPIAPLSNWHGQH